MAPVTPWLRVCLVAACLFTVPHLARAQGSSPVIAAFRANARDVAERTRLAAKAMPADQFDVRAGPSQRSFAEILVDLASRTDYLCSRVALLDAPDRSEIAAAASKDSLADRVTAAFHACDHALEVTPDSDLGESVDINLRESAIGPAPHVSRAYAMTLATAYWAEVYAQLASDLRQTGRAPPEVCRGAASVAWNLNQLCDSGFNRCVDTRRGRGGLGLSLGDGPYSVTSDGQGPYRAGIPNVALVLAARPVGMVLGAPSGGEVPPRAINVDLGHPVPGDIGLPLGGVVATHDLEISAQWYTDSQRVAHSVLDIPVGATVTAQQIVVGFHIDGVYHVLQMGPQGYGHCLSDGTSIHGTGTSRGTIRRATETRWIIDLPPGSIGRLFDDHLGDPNALNRGLYYVSLHFIVDN
jgi:hypothetical protein